jgi:hypothetical protein
MGAIAAGAAQVVGAEAQRLVGQKPVGTLIGKRRPLELEEQQLGLDLGGALLNQLQERPAGRVGGVGCEPKRSERAGTADQFVDRAQLAHGRLQAGAVELGDPPGVLGGERSGALVGLVELAADSGLPLPVDQRA